MSDQWVEIGINDTWNFDETPEFTGFYMAKRDEVGANKSTIYDFRLVDGTMISIWGNAVLDIRLKGLQVGEEVKITYLGKKKSEKSGREFKDFKVAHKIPELGQK